MGSDISRVRRDPLKDFAGIVLQQGRLLLDGDFNEYVAMLDRRLRAETMDLTSYGAHPTEAGVAWVPRLTPNGFRIEMNAGTLTIGRGRMYVDGLLAENHGREPLAFDALLSEATGTVDMPYALQPYWPTPEPLPETGTHLAYLDVWQREVTHLEDPDLIETAIGVDTASRLQTVWQVRVLPNAGSDACSADDADLGDDWLDIIRPSGGRLTTDTIDIDPSTDPCELPPSGGYRGVENQTYRIEIHDGGALGTATFKWSRDNGSVAVPVVDMVSTTTLRVGSLGRDDVLRISTGDWVEILDDHREFNQVPGVMRQVTVSDAARTISFNDPLPTNLRPADAADAAERHLRVRRWDQSGTVVDGVGNPVTDLSPPTASGVIDVPAASTPTTEIVLEHGIVASFSTVGNNGEFRPGDYWIVAARTADTSVERLVAAPPLGIHHHYARLGTFSAPNAETSCRTLWPPVWAGGDDCGDCTVCVTPQSHADDTLTVQQAVDSIAATGGTVCLAPGGYNLGAGVTINQARGLRIRGQGMATVVVSEGIAFDVTNSFDVTIENLAALAGGQSSAAVSLRNVVKVNVQDTVLIAVGVNDVVSAAVAMSGVSIMTAIRRNVLVGRAGIDGSGNGEIGIMTADLSIDDNVIAGIRGIDLGGRSLHVLACKIGSNKVLSTGRSIRATGAVAPNGALDVTDNELISGGTGISVGNNSTVTGNAVSGLGPGGLDGIVVADGGFPVPPSDVQILANRVHDRRGRGIALDVPVRTFMVKQNILTDVGDGIVMAAQAVAGHVAVDNNAVSRVGRGQTTEPATALGIALTNALFVEVSGNTVFDVGTEMVEGAIRAGVLTVGCRDVHVAGNTVYDVGSPDGFIGAAAGISVLGPFERANVSENSSAFSLTRTSPQEGLWWALLIASSLSGVGSLGPRHAVEVGNEALVFTNEWAAVQVLAGGHSTVSGNSLSGGGRRSTCEVLAAGDVIANANQCSHIGESVGALLRGDSIVASSNRVRGTRATLVLQVPEDRFSAVGNLAAGGTHLGAPGDSLPAPWDALNPTVP